MKTIEQRIAEYREKLEKQEESKKNERTPLNALISPLLDEIAKASPAIKRELAPVVGRLQAFVEGRAYFTRNKGAKA